MNESSVTSNVDFEEYAEVQRKSLEAYIKQTSNVKVYGTFKKGNRKVRTDVGFVDLRVLTLEEFFSFYKSPLENYADEFIEACEKYDVDNWQLIPAIAINETGGCNTDISDIQKNCWGWGGAFPNRWIFYSYEEAIDIITSRMISSYGNDRMNAKDIQSTYCGANCMASGWKWAKGVQGYVVQINDFGEKYKLPRTSEDIEWS